LHVNHWKYISTAFGLAKKVKILITNPNRSAKATSKALHRGALENNPLTYSQRVRIFKAFFKNIGIPASRYEFARFDIRDKKVWKKVLNKKIPNLINTYGSPWSKQKLKDFKASGFPVIQSGFLKTKPISGTEIRKILKSSLSPKEKKKQLIKAGFMPEAINGLFKTLK